MYQLERINAMKEYIDTCGSVSIRDLSEHFGVSAVTVRKDIDDLCRKKMIVKTHGGALSVRNNLYYETPYETKTLLFREEKIRIGKLAASLIEDNDTIFLDSGTTTLEVARNINRNNVTAVTHDLNIAMELSKNKNVELVVAGGVKLPEVYTLIGSETVEFIKKLRVNKSFMGCDGISVPFGVSNSTLSEVEAKLAIMKACNQLIMVTDSSKFGKEKFYSLFDISEVDIVVTDSIAEETRKELIIQNVEVLIA